MCESPLFFFNFLALIENYPDQLPRSFASIASDRNLFCQVLLEIFDIQCIVVYQILVDIYIFFSFLFDNKSLERCAISLFETTTSVSTPKISSFYVTYVTVLCDWFIENFPRHLCLKISRMQHFTKNVYHNKQFFYTVWHISHTWILESSCGS